MPIERPSLPQIHARVRGDINAGLPGADSSLRHSNLGVLSAVIAGASHGLYGYLATITDRLIPDTAKGIWLERWARIFGITRQSATPATGTATVTGDNGAGIPVGTVLRRSDGATYFVQTGAVIAAGSAEVAIEAEADGSAGNATDGAILNFVSPIAGVDQAVTSGPLLGGGDSEGDANLSARLVSRINLPPHGGAQHDYVAWALSREIHGVRSTRAWVGRDELGPGFVTVRFVMDDDYANGIPQAGDVDAVSAYILEQAPVGAQVVVTGPVAQVENISIDVSPLTPDVQANVRQALESLFRESAEPGGKILISHIREAVSTAAGEFDNAITSPASDIVAATPGSIPTLGNVQFALLA